MSGSEVGKERNGLGLAKPSFGAPVEKLPFAVCRVASTSMVLQLTLHHRQGSKRRGILCRSKKVVKSAEAKFRKIRIFAHFEYSADLLLCDCAAVIAHAEEDGSMIEARSQMPPLLQSGRVGRRRRNPSKSSELEFANHPQLPTKREGAGSFHAPVGA